MHPAAGRSPRQGDTALFLACVACALVALVLPAAWTAAAAGWIRQTALRPVILVQHRAEEDRTARVRLREAIGQRDSAVALAQGLASLAEENAGLRRLVGLAGPAGHGAFVGAEVLHQPVPTEGHTLLLSAGKRHGVGAFMPVVTADGLVGVVGLAEAGSSLAYTWAHDEFRASAVTEDGAVLGIVAPSAGVAASLAELEFRGVAYRDSVPDGTLLVTSGLGGVYPRGIPIGRVRGVRREELGWERIYQVVPMVNPGTVRHALVLTGARSPFPPLAPDRPPEPETAPAPEAPPP